MLKLEMIAVLIMLGIVFQDPAKPKSVSKPSTQNKKPTPFPKDKARWQIRGRVKAQYQLLSKAYTVKGKAIPDESRLCNPPGHMLPNVMVFVVGIERKWSFPGTGSAVKVVLREHRVVPHVVAISAGQWIQFDNERGRLRPAPMIFEATDGKRLRARSKLFGKATFGDFQMNAGAKGFLITFNDPVHGYIRLESPSWLRACLHVLPHPIFAITDKNGRFSLPKLPDGAYELVAMHELLGRITRKVKIEGKPKKSLTFEFKVPEKLRAKPIKGK